MKHAWQANDMWSELLEASNGDKFFISKSEDFKVGI